MEKDEFAYKFFKKIAKKIFKPEKERKIINYEMTNHRLTLICDDNSRKIIFLNGKEQCLTEIITKLSQKSITEASKISHFLGNKLTTFTKGKYLTVASFIVTILSLLIFILCQQQI